MIYLNPADYVAFGLADDTPDALVNAASAMIDSFCRRPTLASATYVERLRLARDGRTVRLSYAPAIAVAACRTRLRSPRADRSAWTPLQRDALAFGLPGTWVAIDPAQTTLYANGELEFQPNLMQIPCDEAEVTYTAGFAAAPTPVQLACAQIVRNAQTTPGLNVKRQQIDSLEMDYFGASLLDDDVKRLLGPYVAVRFG